MKKGGWVYRFRNLMRMKICIRKFIYADIGMRMNNKKHILFFLGEQLKIKFTF